MSEFFENDYGIFAWDGDKNTVNINKHGISFEEASEVFSDDNAIFNIDTIHSYAEERFIIIGLSKISRVLTVCYCERKNGDIIRIISARKATTKEKNLYGGQAWQ